MTKIDTYISEWLKAKDALNAAKKAEKQWRDYILKDLFKDPTEGTNTVETKLFKVKGKFSIDRAIDNAALTANAERYATLGIDLNHLIRLKYELAVAAYRKLNEDQQHAFDESLIIKPGSPSLEVIPNE